MTKISRDDIKKRGFARFLRSFRYSMEGIWYAVKFEQSITVHYIATVATITLALIFNITLMEWCLLFIAIGIVLGAELLNTAIEAVVDMVTLEIHPLAKIAKDTASGAVFVFSLIAAVIGLIVFVPYIIKLF